MSNESLEKARARERKFHLVEGMRKYLTRFVVPG